MKQKLHTYWNKLNAETQQLIALLFVYMVLHFAFFHFFYWGFLGTYDHIYDGLSKAGIKISMLAYKPYDSWSIFMSALLHPVFVTGTFLLGALIFKYRKNIAWQQVEDGKWIKWLAFAAAFALAWELATYDYNYYLDQGHYFDRLLLVVLAFLILLNPAFIPVFLIVALLFRSQFNYPVDGFTLYDKRLLFDVLILFNAFAWLQIRFKKLKIKFLFVVLCLVASNYFMTAVAKVLISQFGIQWLVFNDLQHMFINANIRGWLAQADAGTIESMTGFLQTFNRPLHFLIFFTELAALFLLWRRKTTVLLLGAFILMHLGIFIFGSMIFWKWMLMDAVLIILLWRMPESSTAQLFSKRGLKISMVLIVFSFIWFKPFRIGWHDTPFNQFFTYEVVDENGITYQVAKNQMNPYHQWFQYDQFLFLMDEKFLKVSGFGYTFHKKTAARIRKGKAPDELISHLGKSHYDSAKANAFEEFIQTYFKHRNKYVSHPLWLTKIAPPHHIYNSVSGRKYNGTQKVKTFRVIFNQTFISDSKVSVLRREVIREINIPGN